MYSTSLALPGEGLDDWGLRRAARQLFTEPAQLSHNDGHHGRFREYVGDLLTPYQLELGPFEGRGQAYGEMAEAVIRQVVAPGEEVDLLILAYAIPDIAPGRATATYLSYVCPGNPLAFAISDQGTAAAFTGLRLVREYARSGGCRRSLLLIVEQAELPYDAGASAALPAAHAAVALLFGPDPVAVLGEVAIRGSVTGAGETVIASPALARHAEISNMDNVVLAPEGQPYTGVWWELAGVLQGKQQGSFLVADYDPQLGYLSTAVISASDQSVSSTR